MLGDDKIRDIEFRGLTIGGKWVYGNLSILNNKNGNIEAGHYISNRVGSPFAYMVRPETVGELIGGLQSGNKIYEGDICECDRYESHTKYVVHMKDIRFVHEWARGSALNSIKVIGNEHENPDMI